MRIDGGYHELPKPGRKTGRIAQGASTSSASRSEKDSVTESAVQQEGSSLIVNLREIPEIRPEVIEEVRRKLAQGEFMSRENAEKTAEAILEDLASFIGA